jgi:hypothetical protein
MACIIACLDVVRHQINLTIPLMRELTWLSDCLPLGLAFSAISRVFIRHPFLRWTFD